jgi:catechol 2,3-dioxygenase-like lactoylglutathione lyase family enzyme
MASEPLVGDAIILYGVPPTTEDAVPSTGFNHVAIFTPDLDRLVDFYITVFDAEITLEMEAREGHPRMKILDLGGDAALNVAEAPAEEIIGQRNRMGSRGPIDHFGVAVDSLKTLEATRDRLRELGVEAGDVKRLGTEWSVFFRDPDGMELEVNCKAREGDEVAA